jgi:hypothetical protein
MNRGSPENGSSMDRPDVTAAPDSAPSRIISSEFAHIRVSVKNDGNGPVLHIQDERSGAERTLDALMLECLARVDEDLLVQILDPKSVPEWR